MWGPQELRDLGERAFCHWIEGYERRADGHAGDANGKEHTTLSDGRRCGFGLEEQLSSRNGKCGGNDAEDIGHGAGIEHKGSGKHDKRDA